MRVAMAGFLHETNTFAPEPADMAAFKAGGGYVPMVGGPAMIDAFQEVNLGMTGALKVAGDSGWDVVPVLWAGAIPSAPVTQDAFDTILGEILDGLRAAGPLDGVFLDLHGAMVATHHDDGEGEIARQVRALVGPDVPIAAALDLHGNISEEFVNTVDVLAGFRTYPHIDMADTGAAAARLLDHVMQTGTRPAKAFRRMSYLVPIPFQTTDMQPAKGLYENLTEVEAQGALSASLFMGAKITHLGELPQGQPERYSRVVDMVAQHDHEGFGGCTNIGECTSACPKEIPLDVISQLNKDLRDAMRMGL